LAVAIAEAPLMWTLALVAAWKAWRNGGARGPVAPEVIVCGSTAAVLLVAFLATPFPHSHNLLAIVVLVAIVASREFHALEADRWPALAANVVALLLIVKVGVLCFAYDENR